MKTFLLLCLMTLFSVPSSSLTLRPYGKHKRHYKSSFVIFQASHRSIAQENYRANLLRYKKIKSLTSLRGEVAMGHFVSIKLPCEKPLSQERRYVLPSTEEFLEQLNQEFETETGTSLVVDSAIRPASIQARLLRWNRNAAPAYGDRASTHERGTTVDLSRRMSAENYRWLMLRLAYYQLRGKVLVIEESNCIHIFVGEDPHDQDIPGYTVQTFGNYELQDTAPDEGSGSSTETDDWRSVVGRWCSTPDIQQRSTEQ